MRKKVIITLIILITLFMPSCTTFAASGLNSEEQAIVDRIKAGYTVDGKQYYVESQYINQGVNYLSRDGIDITAAQKVSVLAKLEQLAPQGVTKGYLKPVAVDSTKATEDTQTQEETEPVKDKQTDIKGNTSDIDQSQAGSDSEQSTTEIMTMSEIIDSAQEITKDMDISVSYDLEANEIKVINSEGKAVIAANRTIKNTGFSLNTTVVIVGILLCSLGCSIGAAAKFNLFSSQEELHP